jgi:hypothetical protein
MARPRIRVEKLIGKLDVYESENPIIHNFDVRDLRRVLAQPGRKWSVCGNFSKSVGAPTHTTFMLYVMVPPLHTHKRRKQLGVVASCDISQWEARSYH